jgi:RHS repeat-associated protein
MVVSATTIQASTPAHAAGVVDVTVTTPGGTSATNPADQFTYVPADLPALRAGPPRVPPPSGPPVVTGVSPNMGSTVGGYTVTISGSNFTGASQVLFGVSPATSFSVQSDTMIQATVPAYAVDTVYPVASYVQYRNTDGTGAETTSYGYTWFSNSTRIQSMTVQKPVITPDQNGPANGAPDVETTVYDNYSRPIWTRNSINPNPAMPVADGFISYTEYDQATGAVVKTIEDVDTSRTSDFQNLPAGWVTPAGGGLHLRTLTEVDTLGRPTAVTRPNGNVTYTVYNDTNHEVRTYAGWNTATNLPTGPTQVRREDRGHDPSYVETLTMAAVPHVTNGRPDGTEAVANVQTLSRTFTSPGGQVSEKDAYFFLGALPYSTNPYIGTAGTNYYATLYDYDSRGRRYRTTSPTGTITQTDYDGLGRAIDSKVGTSLANLVMVSQDVYDQATPGGPGGIGDGNLTQMTEFPGGAAAARRTDYFYDWRDRLVASKEGVQASEDTNTHRPIAYTQYDNLGEAVSTESYDGDGITVTTTNGVPDRPAANRLRAKTTSQYDNQGRVYRTNVYSVDQGNGTVSANNLVTNTWYDHRGNTIKTSQPGGLVTKTSYDGVDRPKKTYTTNDLAMPSWEEAGTVSNNIVLSQTENQYDANGNVILTVTRDRFHDAAAVGELGTPTMNPKARVSYVASYYDLADRETDTVDVGTNGGTAYVRPATPPAMSSDTVLITHTDYNAAGWASLVTDPRGLKTQTTYDMLHRATQTVQAYTDGIPTNTSNRVTAFTYDGANHVLTQSAVLPNSVTQTTQYVYGVTTTGGSDLNSNDLLGSVIYPANGQPNKVTYSYNALAEPKAMTDRNQTAHAYGYDVLGRQTADAVSTLGTGVDGLVRRIETAYDSGGRAALYTSYDVNNAVVNQVQQVYDGLGQLVTEAQSHAGAVTGGTPAVQYAYSFNAAAGGANHSRLVSVTYPNGRVLNYTYNAGLDDSISRLSAITDNSGTPLEQYTYLGAGSVVQRAHPEAGVDLTYIKRAGEPDGEAGDQYTGLDRFGRAVDQRWVLSATGTATDRFQYGYDRDGNPQYRNNLVNTAFGELYHASGAGNAYDNFNQMTAFGRGTLSASQPGGPLDTVTGTHSQSWGLDALGNWSTFTNDAVTQTRSHNLQNQITALSPGGVPAYDNNGNTTADDQGTAFVYDAWNRLVRATNAGGTTVAYGYDALSRRITVSANGGTPTDLYYSAISQVVEERVAGVMQAQYVWSPVFVDAMIERDTAGGPRLYVQQDANWNVTAVVNTAGAVQERYVYDPYGKPTVLDPNTWQSRSGSQFGWVYLHQGGRYDGNSGLYYYRNRDLSPTLGRWMEQDPASYADSMNLYTYLDSQPATTIDPSGDLPILIPIIIIGGACLLAAGCSSRPAPAPADDTPPKLTLKTIKGPTAGNCGAFAWVIQWILDKPTKKGGWVVQKVDVSFDVKDCDDNKLDVKKASGGKIDPAWWPLWEAWEIHKGQKVTTYAETGDTEDDTYASGGFGECTKGTHKITGSADFYDGLTLPKDFKATGKPPTGILPTTQKDPGLKGGSGAINHNLTATWNCCPKGHIEKTKLTTDP